MLKRSGNVITMSLFLWPLLFSLALFVHLAGRGTFLSFKMRTLAEMSVLSSERINAQSLETIAGRWQEFGDPFGPVVAPGRVFLPSAAWNGVRAKAQELRRAIPSYQGRATSVIKVVAEANGAPREQITAPPSISLIGLSPQPLTLQDETGREETLDAGWYRRTWTTDQRLAWVKSAVVHSASVLFSSLSLERTAAAHVVWDVDPTDTVVNAQGNGGYSRMWSEAEQAGRLRPQRWAVFRAERTSR